MWQAFLRMKCSSLLAFQILWRVCCTCLSNLLWSCLFLPKNAFMSNMSWFVFRLPVHCYWSGYPTGGDCNSDCCCPHATQEAYRRVSTVCQRLHKIFNWWEFAFEFWSWLCVRDLKHLSIDDIFTPVLCDSPCSVVSCSRVTCIRLIARWLDSLPCLRECAHQISACSTGCLSLYLALISAISHIHQKHSLTKDSLPNL